MNFKTFAFMLLMSVILCIITWFFVFRNLSFPGVELVSSAIYLLIIISFIVMALQI